MIDMVAVNREVERGRAELAASSEGILSLKQRTRIWVAMNDPDDPEASYRHRTYLKVACVRHVQHYWDRTFPSNPGVEEMLALTQALIDRKADPKRAEERAEDFFDDIMAHTDVTPDLEPAIGVADAASGTAMTACYRNPDYDIADGTEDDDELLPASLEPSYSCASAAAGGMNWQPAEELDIEARRAFWTWYLDEAIPWALTT
ncbi:Imm5 family immunity protein [uncultured Actinomyces sp.]|uniref:Imm5 family immunity protein n=1 Tax=uncultured Actinomyces sp. TaxID=249061 RepID=UPI0028F0BA8D|nr:Imm5 family immunity protein [uncultured Actinomyces sp.]